MTYSENSAKNLARIDWPMNDVLFDVPLQKKFVNAFCIFLAFCCKSTCQVGLLPTLWEAKELLNQGSRLYPSTLRPSRALRPTFQRNSFLSNLFSRGFCCKFSIFVSIFFSQKLVVNFKLNNPYAIFLPVLCCLGGLGSPSGKDRKDIRAFQSYITCIIQNLFNKGETACFQTPTFRKPQKT